MKIIRNENDYNKALIEIEKLIDLDPELGTEAGDNLEVLSLLIEKYEEEHYPIDKPSPIEAIKFRMEQEGLSNLDLVKYIGSKSKVSEVLNGKRKLSLSMIRNLHKGLGISAEVLIADPSKTLPEEIPDINWKQFPLNQMIKEKWIDFKGSLHNAKDNAEEIIRDFYKKASLNLNSEFLLRQNIRINSVPDEYALKAWQIKVVIEANKIKTTKKYTKEALNDDFFKDLRALSRFSTGPLSAQEFLLEFGIKLVIVKHLKKTYLDGATFINDNTPIIGLTLRYDRIDSFWFTLFHELAHVKLHLNENNKYFFDDLKSKTDEQKENEADEFARNSLIDKDSWNDFYKEFLTKDDVKEFANDYKISPAIVAGRIQYERNNYRVFRNLLQTESIRNMFKI